ncbi:MAG: AgmX/PglI C-terminal domain-containing protein [Myxococcales bacterium]|nr:AgmX/PglI C-terminal domain-containing protein [Myxococcales bacterium]
MRQQDGTRTTGRLEVVVEWRGTVLDVRHLGPGDTFTVGDARGADLALEHPALPAGQAVVVARVDGGEARVFAPPGGRGRLRLGDATEDFGGVAKLGAGARARIELDDLALVCGLVEAAAAPTRKGAAGPDAPFRRACMGLAAGLHLAFLAVALSAPVSAAGLSVDPFGARPGFVDVVLVPREAPEDDPFVAPTVEAGGGEGGGGAEQAAAAPTPVRAERPRDTAPGADPEATAERAKAKARAVAKATTVAIENEMAAAFGGQTLGNDAHAALNALHGETRGLTAGLHGSDFDLAAGPGGEGETVALTTEGGGIPGLNRPAGPAGRRGPKRPGGRPGPEGTAGTKVPPVTALPPVVEGALSKEDVRRTVARYRREIRYCYEKRLNVDRDLNGKVSVKFVIGGTGDVLFARVFESTMPDPEVGRCMEKRMMRWRFPKPAGGGTVTVRYPFLFRPTR